MMRRRSRSFALWQFLFYLRCPQTARRGDFNSGEPIGASTVPVGGVPALCNASGITFRSGAVQIAGGANQPRLHRRLAASACSRSLHRR